MTFDEALQLMKSGHKIHRPNWTYGSYMIWNNKLNIVETKNWHDEHICYGFREFHEHNDYELYLGR